MSRTYEQLEPVISALDERISVKAEQINALDTRVTAVEGNVDDIKSAITLEKVNIIDSTKYNSSNNAVTYNGDGTYTIGTTDYGTTVFNNNEQIALQIGTYELYGVPNGIAFISPSTSYSASTAIASNDSNSPKTIIISEPVMAYVGFRISPKPTSSFVITPFLKKTISIKTEIADIKQEIDYISESTYNLAKFENEKYTTFSVLVELNEKGEAKFSGTASNSGTNGQKYKELTLASGTYQLRAIADSETAPITRVYKSSDDTLLAGAGNTFTLENSTDIFITFAFTRGTTYSTTVSVMLAPANVPSEIVPAVSAVDAVARQKINGMENFLSGKKLFCAGDSITEAVNVGTLPNGYKKSYAGYVATRNSMVYVSDGVGGSTIAKCTVDGTVHNNFITSRYKNIPTDADYITIWFGWNDQAYGWKSMRDAYCVTTYGTYYNALTSAQQNEVDSYRTWRQWLSDYAGTVDSTSENTWSGAWNIVLTWLITNCPNSRVGIVIAYGISEELYNALIAVCEKYGVAYVKAYDPHEFFSVGHSLNIGTEQAARRKALYTLDGTHPNELGYDMMSASYEQFIRRI